MHLPTEAEIHGWRDFTPDRPMRVLVSACLSGAPCGVDGSSYGEYPVVQQFIRLQNVQPIPFCPEDFSFGTPREMCNIYGGDGFNVLDGRARVKTDSGEDWTEGMVRAARQMLEVARANSIHLAILMDVSAACGSQVIYDGPRHLQNYQVGAGVCAALLLRNGYKVVSQRDYRTLERLLHKLDRNHRVDAAAVDHHETEWYREYFGREG
jgi:uncharacterized protein YbbK (DUF523 family)